MPERSPFSLRVDGREVPLTVGEHHVGRSPACDIVLQDNLVSRHHAVLRATAEQLVVEDTGSYNGIVVDGRRVNGRQVVGHGSRITIAAFEMVALDERSMRHKEKTTVPLHHRDVPGGPVDDDG